MAEVKSTFPILPEKWWWTLRTRFKQSINVTVNSNYIATVLGIGQDTAAKIAIPAIRKVGLIDKSGKPTSLALQWHDDSQYAETCREMLQSLYPQDLLNAIPNPREDRSTVERWFANITGAGQSAVVKMTSFYQLLYEGDVSKQKEVEKRTEKESVSKSKPRLKRSQSTTQTVPKSSQPSDNVQSLGRQLASTEIHPALEMLVRSLPPLGSSFSQSKREQWIKMARETFTFLYLEDNEQ